MLISRILTLSCQLSCISLAMSSSGRSLGSWYCAASCSAFRSRPCCLLATIRLLLSSAGMHITRCHRVMRQSLLQGATFLHQRVVSSTTGLVALVVTPCCLSAGSTAACADTTLPKSSGSREKRKMVNQGSAKVRSWHACLDRYECS